MTWRNTPEPTLKYGLNVFFNPKTVGLALEDGVSTAPANVRVPEGVFVMPLAEALGHEKYEPLLAELLAVDDGREERLTAWHRAHVGNGTVIHVPAGLQAAAPIRIDVLLGPGDVRRAENVVIIAEEGSRVTVVEHLQSAPAIGAVAAPKLRSSITDVIAHPRSHVTHISLQDFSAETADLSVRRATVARDASITWVEGIFGAGYAQSRVITALAGEGAAVDAKSMFFGHEEQKFDLYHDIRHRAPRTRSDLSVRGALAGSAKAVARGMIRIEKGAVGSVGQQREDVLLLSPKAEIDTIPNLEIGEPDVRCGHGATVGRIDAEKMFYLMSRGLDEAAARRFLVEGFFAPLVADMRAAGMGDSVECLVAERAERISGAGQVSLL